MNSVKLVATLPDGKVLEGATLENTTLNREELVEMLKGALSSDHLGFWGEGTYYGIPSGLLKYTLLEVVEFDAET